MRYFFAAVLMLSMVAPAVAQETDRKPQPESRPFFQEPTRMKTAFDFAGKYLGESGERKAGWYPVFKTNVTGDGWISAGSGYRVNVLNQRGWLDGSAAFSWRGYKTAQGSFEYIDLANGRMTVGTQLLWQDLTQVQYFGAGRDRTRDIRTDYRVKSTDLIGFTTYRVQESTMLEGTVGWVTRPTISASAGLFDRDYPDATLIFALEPGFESRRQPPFLHGQVAATVDTRDAPGHPTRGGVYRAASSFYSDQDTGQYSFRRHELEALHLMPVSPGRWTLAFHGWTVISETGDDRRIPAYLLPSLGGSTTLRSYSDYRFHDRHLLLLSAESRWALFEHVDFAVFADAGSVASRVRDLTLKEASYGVGVRAHVRSSTIARVDVAHGREGWRLLFRLNEPFRLNRLTRRHAAVPFVP